MATKTAIAGPVVAEAARAKPAATRAPVRPPHPDLLVERRTDRHAPPPGTGHVELGDFAHVPLTTHGARQSPAAGVAAPAPVLSNGSVHLAARPVTPVARRAVPSKTPATVHPLVRNGVIRRSGLPIAVSSATDP